MKRTGAAGLVGAMGGLLRAAPAADTKSSRIGLTSAVFRFHFPVKSGERRQPHLTLEAFPRYVVDRYGLRHIEFHSAQVESLEPAYLEKIRAAVGEAGCTLTNIQGPSGEIASGDESVRSKAVDLARRWIDAAVLLGAKAIRINTGKGDSLPAVLRSFREINRYASGKGMTILVENHGGLSDDPENLVRIIEETPGPKIYANPDFGNFSADIRESGLKRLLPYVGHQICAKVRRFDDKMEHLDYDFDHCIRLCEEGGFRGVYSCEQYDQEIQADYEKIADWMIQHIRAIL